MVVSKPTDTIVPLHYFDDTGINRSIVLYITLCFDVVLDPQKLRHGLERLLQIGDWRKLGARLRMTDKGKLEYHIPTTFDEKRVGIGFSHVSHDIPIADHPLASRIPRPTQKPSLHCSGMDFKDLARRPDGPRKLADYLNSDEPQISLHVVSLKDATLVSLSWSHTFLDAMGMSAVINAWVAVLDGREQDVPPICNFDKDPLATLGTAPKEQYLLAKRQIAGFNMIRFAFRYLWDLMWYKDESRTLYLPASFVQDMRNSALKDLQKQPPTENSQTSEPFLSEGDVLCAFITRLAINHVLPTSETPVGVMNIFNYRSVLSSTYLPPSAGICLSNAVSQVVAFSRACDILAKPISYTASLVRQSIVEQGTAEQIDAFAELARNSYKQTGNPPVFGDPGMIMVVFSNWTKAKFFDFGFSSAVADGHTADKGTIKPSFVNLSGEANGFSPRGSWPILGRDQSGGYWLQGNLRSTLWAGVEQEIAAL